MLQAQSWFKLLSDALARGAATGAATAGLVPLALQPATAAELVELQLAVAERFGELQQDWWQGWNSRLEEFGQLRQADTLSEHMELHYNLFEQCGALWKTQAADLLDLQDTVAVNYGYWVTQKLREPAAA
jgi:hypothetical protein